jgi:F0F1-type ATP synthase alpha subunit
MNRPKDLCDTLMNRVSGYSFGHDRYEYGKVTSSGDGIIHIEGLRGRKYGELLSIEGGALAIALENIGKYYRRGCH